MSNETDRDRTTDALLRARLRARDAGGDGHLDAETLAAWADGAIYGADATGIEAHLADCARCQAMMASFATSEPAGAPAAARVPAAVVPFRPRPIMKWLPLVGTAAAAVLIWAVWPHPTPEPPPITMADASRPAEAREVPPLPSAPTAQTARAAEPKSKTEVAGRTADTAGQVGQANAPARQVAGSQAAAAAPPPPPPPAQKPPVPTPSVATGAAAADRNAAAELRAAPAREPEVVVAEFGVIPPTAADIALLSGGGRAGFGGAGGGGRGGRGGGGGGGAAMSVTMARSVDVRWRVLSDGSVQRSTEGSGDWTRVALDPPAHVLSGVAPTATVCWLVGREGAVLLSVDGRTFTKVAFPETADLQSVVAIDARRALVTTSDGRRFLTSDGGATWRLQDSPARPF